MYVLRNWLCLFERAISMMDLTIYLSFVNSLRIDTSVSAIPVGHLSAYFSLHSLTLQSQSKSFEGSRLALLQFKQQHAHTSLGIENMPHSSLASICALQRVTLLFDVFVLLRCVHMAVHFFNLKILQNHQNQKCVHPTEKFGLFREKPHG